nr:MAG TPA: hypothetical protein [Caudoviricetes sp.]
MSNFENIKNISFKYPHMRAYHRFWILSNFHFMFLDILKI